ncbi:hypothetical protein EV702DRAFT_1212246 [Suillus placidus]|uniref:Endonuclease n=1 Tax=Suillus placidus TaxID=48579 RepID=A0A9P7CWG2_9AGAM|nr:hypothetical protein EV702DRAFT_1212246 [Suillus placidus]
MPSPATIHAAYFAVGAVVGGSVVSAVASRKRQIPITTSANTSVAPPIIEIGLSGGAKLSNAVTASALSSPVLKYGHPGPVPDLFVRKAYTAAYDRRLRHPAWASCFSMLQQFSDESLPAMFRAKLQDYFRSGCDGGHMVPAADAKLSQEAMDETFLLSNIAPQVGVGINRHYWAYLEDWCRRLTGSFSDVCVFTIPLYLPRNDADGEFRVVSAVLTHFAKVVLTSRPLSPSAPDVLEISTGAFVLPNAIIPDDAPLEGFVIPVDVVERAAGLILFSDAVKANSKHICKSTKCDAVVRRFDDAQKRPEMRRAISAPK